MPHPNPAKITRRTVDRMRRFTQRLVSGQPLDMTICEVRDGKAQFRKGALVDGKVIENRDGGSDELL